MTMEHGCRLPLKIVIWITACVAAGVFLVLLVMSVVSVLSMLSILFILHKLYKSVPSLGVFGRWLTMLRDPLWCPICGGNNFEQLYGGRCANRCTNCGTALCCDEISDDHVPINSFFKAMRVRSKWQKSL